MGRGRPTVKADQYLPWAERHVSADRNQCKTDPAALNYRVRYIGVTQ